MSEICKKNCYAAVTACITDESDKLQGGILVANTDPGSFENCSLVFVLFAFPGFLGHGGCRTRPPGISGSDSLDVRYQ